MITVTVRPLPAALLTLLLLSSSAFAQSEEQAASASSADETTSEETPNVPSASVSFEDFFDVDATAWYAPYVRPIIEWGIASGYRDENGTALGLFGPADAVTVGQLLKMAMTAAGINPQSCADSQVLGDLPQTWVAPYAACAMHAQWRLFERRVSLERPILRGEALGLIHDVFGSTVPPLPSAFTDTLHHPYAADIAFDAARKIVAGTTNPRGKPTGLFLPNGQLNRAEAAKILFLTIHTDNRTAPMGQRPAFFDLQVIRYSFSPVTIVVERGQKVTLRIKDGEQHTFNIDELDIHTPLKHAEEVVTFTAEKSGIFTFYCDLPGHSAAGMVGQLIVK